MNLLLHLEYFLEGMDNGMFIEKDTNISNQLACLINWKVVKSSSDKHPKYGYPMGQVLCRTLEEAQEYVKNSEFTDCFITDYED